MPIVTPGKRPAKRFEKSKILGGKISRGKKATNTELNVIPMVDMMTMLVIFLLQQFSATGEVLYMQKDIKMPEAKHGGAIEQAPVIAVSPDAVVVTGVKVADLAELDRDGGYLNIPGLEERLRDEKKRWEYIHANDPTAVFPGLVNLQADKGIPFRIVKRVQFSAGVAGYWNVNYATLGAENEAPPATTPKS